MPKLVQKSGYIRAGKAGGYMRYIATRENVEKLDRNADEALGREQYMKYIATRPRVERHGEHGLFSSVPSVSLDAALRELNAHEGNVYTFIYSLRREDAERLGYDHAEAWRTLICGKQVELATAMNIPPDKLRWYAAFHDEGHHPHIHMMVWSDDPKQGHLTKEGLARMRSELTTTIFQDELLNLYQEKDMSYKEAARSAREAMRNLIAEMQESICDAPEIEQQLVALSESLASAKGKKQYQYLKKDVKRQVDAIVDALAALPPVAECYEAWNRCKDALDNYYHDQKRERKPLSQQPEFRAIKNMVIREADVLRRNVLTFEDERMNDEPDQENEWEQSYYDAKEVLYDDYAPRDEKEDAMRTLEELSNTGGSDAAYLLGKAWRDGLYAPPWNEEAEKWFRVAAERGNDAAQYALGKLLLQKPETEEEGIDWLARSADQGNEFALYRLGKMGLTGDVIEKNIPPAIDDLTESAERGNRYAQYTLGKAYLQGGEVEQNMELAEHWLSEAAYQGHEYAQFFLEHMDRQRKPSVVLAATRLLYDLANIFRSNTPTTALPGTIHIDRKRRREIMEKRIALGHREDDHEEAANYKYMEPTMSMW